MSKQVPGSDAYIADIIKTSRESLDSEQARITGRYNALRTICPHPNVIKVSKGSSGNYDPSNDGYWKDCSCPDCGKQWSEGT